MAVPLWKAWDELAPRLAAGTMLAGFDYDGTLVPIRPTPEEAVADTTTRAALARLAATAGTVVAVVSGRPVAQLRDLVPGDGLWLVGLHGLEIAAPHGETLPTIDLDAAAALLAPLRRAAVEIAARHPGVRVEDKGATLALHVRLAERRHAAAATDELGRATRGIPGLEVMRGKEVLEVRPAGASKGDAMRRLRRDAGGEVVIYAGDDTTDEDAFATLEGSGWPEAVTVRVGRAGPTRARFTLASPAQVGELLRRLTELRQR